jgi:uncharacterized protein
MQASETTTSAVPPPPRPAPPPAAMGPFAGPRQRPRTLQFALFVAAIAWYYCARAIASSASSGLALRFDIGDVQPLLDATFRLFLVVLGVALLRSIEHRRAPLRLTLGLPRRSTARAEWGTGAAIGWGIAVFSILPMALGRALDVQLWLAPRSVLLLTLSLATLAIASLSHALAIYGYGFQRLIEATGGVRATFILIALVAIHASFAATPYGTPEGTRIAVEMLAALLLCLCWFRTHGLWLLWGLRFAWAASITILFGLPIGGNVVFTSIVNTRANGPAWLTGADYGPAAAGISILLLLAAIPILIRVTSDYAWDYTHPPIIPAGYDVTIAPPAAHVAMEEAAQESKPVNPASLVQIHPATPQDPGAGGPSR